MGASTQRDSPRSATVLWSRLRHALTTSAWTPIGIGLLLATPILAIGTGLRQQETQHVRSMVRQESNGLRYRVRDRLETHALALLRIAAQQQLRLQQHGWFSRDALEPAARLLIADYPELQAIVLLDRWHSDQFSIPSSYRLEVASPADGLGLGIVQALEMARRTKQATFVRLADDTAPTEESFAIACPVFLGLEFRGTVLGIFRSPELLAPILTSTAAYGFVAGVVNDTQTVHSPFGDLSTLPSATEFELEQSLGMPTAGWKLVVRPTPDLVTDQTSFVPVQILVIGLVCASLLAAAIRHHQVLKMIRRRQPPRERDRPSAPSHRPLAAVPDPSEAGTEPTVDLGPLSRLSRELREKLDESRREILQTGGGGSSRRN